MEGEGGLPPYEFLLGKLSRNFEVLPWELDPSIEPGDLSIIYSVLDMLMYDDAWRQFINNPEELTETQSELIAEIRYLKRDIWGDK